jgi:predicted dehydrogenase
VTDERSDRPTGGGVVNGQIGVGVLGCGYWGVNYLRVFSELPESRVVVACDSQPLRLQEVGRRYPGVILATTLEQMLAVPGLSAVVICTEATTHYRVGRPCLEAGKHVLVEKPLATTVADAERLSALADAEGLTLMVGHTFLYNAGIRKVRECIAQAEFGRVCYLYSARTNLGPIRRDVNAIWDLAPHDVAIFNYLLDSAPEWVSAVGVRAFGSQREDAGFVSLGYPGGVVGHVHVSWADPNKVRELVVVGRDRRIAFDDLSPIEQVRIFEKGVSPLAEEVSSHGQRGLWLRDGGIVSPRIEPSEPLKNQSSHFLECIKWSSRPLSGGREGRQVVQVMEAIDRSLRRQGGPVKVATGEESNGQTARSRQSDRSRDGASNGWHADAVGALR